MEELAKRIIMSQYITTKWSHVLWSIQRCSQPTSQIVLPCHS